MPRTGSTTTAAAPRAGRKPGASATPAAKSAAAEPAQVLGIEISHPDRRLYEKPALTKLELARYYESVSDWLLPHLKDRRVALLRCPDGATGECFFQKHLGEHVPAGIDIDDGMVVIRAMEGVIALVQRGVIEFHTWGAKSPRSDKPDRLTLDLDPDPDIPWRQVADASRLVRELLMDVGLRPFLKTTGGKGLHVVVPLRGAVDWDRARLFCKGVAQHLEAMQPDLFVANMSKAKRAGHIFVDYLRNSDGATAIAAFSARARAGAPVSMPVDWACLDEETDPRGDAFNVCNAMDEIAKRAKQGTDPWADYEAARSTLTAAMRAKYPAD